MQTPKDRYNTTFMWVGWFVCASALFWVLRIWYWGSVAQPLFSDMEDYDRIAHGILARGDFGFDSFFRSSTAPTVPLMRAIQIALFGESLDSWRIFQGVILFTSLLWCAKELVAVSGSRFAGLALVVSVAMSKPSIFWSSRYSIESFAEGFTYLIVATVLYASRRQTGLSFFIAGIITMLGIFVRMSALPLLGLLIAYFLLLAILNRKRSVQARRFVLGSVAFLAGALVVWIPWVARSVSLYGEPVFLTTQGAYAFFWDLGPVSVKLPNGEAMSFRAQELQEIARRDFPNDAVSNRAHNKLVGLWVEQNRERLPELFWTRIQRTVLERDVNLTKVSRENVLPTPIGDYLIDKTPGLVIWGTLCAALLCAVFPSAYLPLAFAVFIPWLFAATTVGRAQMFEPAIPGVLYFGILGVYKVLRALTPPLTYPGNAAPGSAVPENTVAK